MFDAGDMLTFLTNPEAYNLSSLRNEIGIDYKQAQKRMFCLAALGYIQREPPYVGKQIQDQERNLSYNFSMTELGRRQLEQAQKSTPPESPREPVVESNSSPDPVVAKVVKTPLKPTGNFTEALRMVLEYVREEEPDVIGLHLDVSTGKVKLEKRSTVEIDLG